MDRKSHILIAEDERLFQEFLARSLINEGYKISCYELGLDLLNALDPAVHDLVLLDLHLPDEDGIVIARQIRARSEIPIVVLTADSDEDVRISCLSIGVDDFLNKTAPPEELRLRIRNLLRRTLPTDRFDETTNQKVHLNDWVLDTDTMIVRHIEGQEANLTLYEFKTLEILAKAQGRILSRGQILDGLSTGFDGPSDRMVDAYVSRIRHKLADDEIILTIKGVGYKIGSKA